MNKIITVTCCNDCPYCRSQYTGRLEIYEGTSCKHPENKGGKKIFLGDANDRMNVHMKCPLKDKNP